MALYLANHPSQELVPFVALVVELLEMALALVSWLEPDSTHPTLRQNLPHFVPVLPPHLRHQDAVGLQTAVGLQAAAPALVVPVAPSLVARGLAPAAFAGLGPPAVAARTDGAACYSAPFWPAVLPHYYRKLPFYYAPVTVSVPTRKTSSPPARLRNGGYRLLPCCRLFCRKARLKA